MTDKIDQEEINLFRDNVRRFVDNELVPHQEQWDRDGIVPRELWNKVGENCLLCVDIPEQYGGVGASFAHSMVIVEEFSRKGISGLGGGMAVHSDIVAHYILNSGSEAQKQQFLPGMVSGELIGAIAMTEPGTGSDLQGIRTTAVKEGDDWVINGSKTFITNGQHCDFVVVVARTNTDVSGSRGTSLVIVESHREGFQKGSKLEKIGLHSADTSELFFDNVRVPAGNVLGPVDSGFLVLMNELQRERLSLSVGAVAAAEGALEQTVNYVKERTAFGKRIADFQNTRFKLAELQTSIRVNKAFVNECMSQFMEGKLDVASVSMAKLSSTEMQGRVVDECLQLFGGYGYMTEYPIARAFVDARVQRIYGGTSEIMKELISRSLLGK